MQGSLEHQGQVGNFYAILAPHAPAALDALEEEFSAEVHSKADHLLGLLSMTELDEQIYSIMEMLVEANRAVAIVWARRGMCLTDAQHEVLSQLMSALQLPANLEPGWWLWDGTTAVCTPWYPNMASDPGDGLAKFAQSDNPHYRYPWSRI